MRVIVFSIAMCATARAGVDDAPELAARDAWCDGRALSYDEAALAGPDGAERIDVRRADLGCRAGVHWIFLTGAGWGVDRVIARAPVRVRFGGVCTRGGDPTDVTITTGDRVLHCSAFDRAIIELARALAAPVQPRELDDDLEPPVFDF
ncbi:MAG TPA: hypothetical protein VL463_16325 [Kofleriaceae bacterium]|nr:hypothetical protein [Kofleriaceae bacterium]